ncbi:preprotein translocase subunit YajC [Parvularcula lutaonensis]|uniref:Sec translocon accessory complex subunit YajC n=1 Tax=Parvularcula lutaonensis TaxID=491923 RepID=A0ABV7M961_9PROT|nr:preprotein translocase subunit YajC [Parvularcula lutaonensis]GGY41301.1 preprotein translocase subunit YajC [Parvularcula lutaonensis]
MLALTFFIGTAAAQDAGAPGAPSLIAQMIPFLLIFVIFYFLLIRPQQQARKKHQQMVEGVKRGDTVVTAGGLVGKVTKVSDGPEVTVKLADGVEVQVIKATLADVRVKGEPAEVANDTKS